MYCTVFLVQLVMREDGKEHVEKYYVLLNVKSDEGNMNVRSCVVMVLKVCIFSTVMCSRRSVVIVWRVATLPMSCYIVRKITTGSVPQSYAGYLRTSHP
jgi:hypothetical protein